MNEIHWGSLFIFCSISGDNISHTEIYFHFSESIDENENNSENVSVTGSDIDTDIDLGEFLLINRVIIRKKNL